MKILERDTIRFENRELLRSEVLRYSKVMVKLDATFEFDNTFDKISFMVFSGCSIRPDELNEVALRQLLGSDVQHPCKGQYLVLCSWLLALYDQRRPHHPSPLQHNF